MTRKEAIIRIKDHMDIHRMYEPKGTKISEALDMAIKALEQPDIIRCKDCKYWREHKYTPYCGFNVIYTKADDFCSWAERREE